MTTEPQPEPEPGEACRNGLCDHDECELAWWQTWLGATETEAREHLAWMKANT